MSSAFFFWRWDVLNMYDAILSFFTMANNTPNFPFPPSLVDALFEPFAEALLKQHERSWFYVETEADCRLAIGFLGAKELVSQTSSSKVQWAWLLDSTFQTCYCKTRWTTACCLLCYCNFSSYSCKISASYGYKSLQLQELLHGCKRSSSFHSRKHKPCPHAQYTSEQLKFRRPACDNCKCLGISGALKEMKAGNTRRTNFTDSKSKWLEWHNLMFDKGRGKARLFALPLKKRTR